MRSADENDKTQNNYRLGLDMGSASIGWAAIATDNGKPMGILAVGIRRFDAGVLGDIESGKDESRATARRDARGPRRQHWRRQYRLRKVFRILQRLDLLPTTEDDSPDSRHALITQLDARIWPVVDPSPDHVSHQLLPYLLRAEALDNKLERHHLGRALYHLAQRRGFQSNRKAAKADEDAGVVKEGISQLQAEITQTNARTLGEYFSSLDPQESRIRGRWTARVMFQEEFEKIWTKQATYYEDLTDERKVPLYAALFDQRPLKSQKGLIGRCELEPYKRNAPAACLEFQRFRLLQRVNDLEVTQPDGEVRALTPEERGPLIEALMAEGDLTFGKIRKLFGMKKSRTYGRNYQFNFEEGGDKKLIGNRTGAKLAGVLGQWWDALDWDRQCELVTEILAFESEEALARRLQDAWELDTQQAESVAGTLFEPGYASLSRKAIANLLPLMERGMQFATARKEIYSGNSQVVDALDRLPPKSECDILKPLRNPAVERALSELRKIVNALIRKHGKPAEIHIELARDLKHARKRRQEMAERNKQNKKTREDAGKNILAEMKHERYCTRDNKLKVRLAEECGWKCPFTGRGIEMATLVGDQPQFDIEHIIPFSRSLDNSYLNKTLCYHEENRNVKGSRTPWEAYGGTDGWEEILQRVRHFRGQGVKRKLELFQIEKLPNAEDFNSRQLNDTRYMSRLAADYLGLLFGGQIDAQGTRRIRVSPGRVTHYLRQRWDLNSVLGHSDDKNRADHRHHAIDAFVVALTGASEVQLLSKAAQQAEELGGYRLFAPVESRPWDGFVNEVRQAVDAIVVSSRVSRKLNGALHEGTIFSPPKPGFDKKGNPSTFHHVSKPLHKMSKKDVENIVDDRIRTAVTEQLERLGGEPKDAFKDPNNHPYVTAKNDRIIPIHKPRIKLSAKPMIVGSGTKSRYVNPGANHHIAVFSILNAKGDVTKWDYEIVSRFAAVQRHANGQPVIQREHGPNTQFLFSLSPSEHVMMQIGDQPEKLYRLLSISKNDFEFILHTDARPSTLRKEDRIRIRSMSKLKACKARKVTVAPLGKVHPASD